MITVISWWVHKKRMAQARGKRLEPVAGLAPIIQEIDTMELNYLHTGDAREICQSIPDESVDLIFCDPVYENIEDYKWLGELAMRVLKPNSACLAWSSTRRAAHCQFALVDSGLDYVYTLNYTVQAKPFRLMHYQLFLWTTPCLWMAKGKTKANWIPDTFLDNSGNSENPFIWQKNTKVIRKWLTAFSKPGDTVLDPFAGSGTVPSVCKQLGRNYLACEIDPMRAEMARQRIEQTPMPLFSLELEKQTELEIA